jgi:hypothetical protein
MTGLHLTLTPAVSSSALQGEKWHLLEYDSTPQVWCRIVLGNSRSLLS